LRVSTWLAIAALNGALAVSAGAFSSHGANMDSHSLGLFEIAARYHMYHALALGLAALAMRSGAGLGARIAAWLFLAGILLFSGSLYALALTGVPMLRIFVPFGGTAFIAGWIVLAIGGLRMKS
jgi:uncharacterized membrane protein YgdD (TMEM256/DUF423 family)